MSVASLRSTFLLLAVLSSLWLALPVTLAAPPGPPHGPPPVTTSTHASSSTSTPSSTHATSSSAPAPTHAPPPPPVNITCPGCTRPIRVTTYDTNQEPTSQFRALRLQTVLQYFTSGAGASDDLVCLQDLWDARQKNQVINALRSQFPFSITAPRRNPQCRAGCDPGETARLHACIARNKCSGSGNVITDVCVARNCRAEQNPSLSFKLKEQSCRNVVNADTRRCPLLFDGENDVILLSKTPFTNAGSVLFRDSPSNSWGAVFGSTNTAGVSVNAFCTHLVGPVPRVNLRPDNAQQIQELVSFVNSKDFTVLLGNFECGPQTEDSRAVWLANYGLITSSGYKSVWVDDASPTLCTLCSANPNNGAGTSNVVIDHIFVRPAGRICTKNVTRILTENSIILGNRRIPASAHYGLTAQLCLGTTPTRDAPEWKGPVANDLAENTTDTNWAQDAGAVTSVSEGDTEPVPTDTNDVPVNSEEDTQGDIQNTSSASPITVSFVTSVTAVMTALLALL